MGGDTVYPQIPHRICPSLFYRIPEPSGSHWNFWGHLRDRICMVGLLEFRIYQCDIKCGIHDWLERFASKNSWDPETCMTEQKVLVAHAKASRKKSCHFMEQRFHHCHPNEKTVPPLFPSFLPNSDFRNVHFLGGLFPFFRGREFFPLLRDPAAFPCIAGRCYDGKSTESSGAGVESTIS